MSRLPLASLGVAILAATGALAQNAGPGFFPPTPDGDVALTKIVPPKEPATPATALTAAEVEKIEAERVAVLRAAEEELARADREAADERARAQALPPPVAPGAFNGVTSERGR